MKSSSDAGGAKKRRQNGGGVKKNRHLDRDLDELVEAAGDERVFDDVYDDQEVDGALLHHNDALEVNVEAASVAANFQELPAPAAIPPPPEYIQFCYNTASSH